MTLTNHDKHVIAQARELVALGGVAEIGERTGEEDRTMALASVWGEAKWVLGELANLADRLAAAGITEAGGA